MTITIPSSRNSFHPAWLLLLVPPLANLAVIWWSPNQPNLVGHGILLAASLLAVLPLVWLRAGPVGGRTQRLLKELRTLLPGCLVATLVPGLLLLGDGRDMAGWAFWFYGFGCLLMGASAFGSEFEQRTMAGLLAQPLSRGSVFLEKLGVLGALLLFVTINFLSRRLLDSPGQPSFESTMQLLAIPLFVFCSGPLFSLLSRSTLAALIFTLAIPFILALAVLLPLQTVYRARHPGEEMPEFWFFWTLTLGSPVYLLGSALLGWRVFSRLEVREGGAGGRSSPGLHPLSRPVDAVLGRFLPSAGGTMQLVRKELRLHIVPWLVASLMVGLWLLWLAVRHFATSEELRETLNQMSSLMIIAVMLSALITVGTGAACVAEERELGTLEWQLTQPVSLRRQWMIKVAVTLALAFILGVLLPALLLGLGFGWEALGKAIAGSPFAGGLTFFGGLFLTVLAIGVYASSISRNTMKATATAAGVAMGFGGGVVGALTFLNGILRDLPYDLQDANALAPAWAPSQGQMMTFGAGCYVLLTALYVSALFWLGGRNCRRLIVPVRDVSRQLAGVTLGLLVAMVGLGAVFTQFERVRRQADAVATLASMRHDGESLVRGLITSGKMPLEIYSHFGVPTNATPATLAEAIFAAHGINGVSELSRLLNPPTKRTPYSMDPVLARRYGLIPQGGSTPTNTNAPASQPSAAGTPKVFLMDPVLARRYGLIPNTNQPATDAPAAPSGK